MGRIQSGGLRQYLAQRMGIDTTYMVDFVKGFQKSTLSEEELRTKARLAGTEIRQQVEGQLIPGAQKQINDSIDMLDVKRFIQGFQDGVMNLPIAITDDSVRHIVQKQVEYYHREKMLRLYSQNLADGEAFLQKNAKEKDVKVTPSGLQYKVITAGEGEKPQPTSRVKVHYEGRLIDGTVFDSSYKRNQPATFPVNQVIKGWTEALSMMPVGSKWEIYIPQELAYGDREQKEIPPFSCLIFTVELLEILQ